MTNELQKYLFFFATLMSTNFKYFYNYNTISSSLVQVMFWDYEIYPYTLFA